jgi:hypothetical protein
MFVVEMQVLMWMITIARRRGIWCCTAESQDGMKQQQWPAALL